MENLGTKLEKEMKSNDKPDNILTKYEQYLRLEKSLSSQTIEAYLADLQKLLDFLQDEKVNYSRCSNFTSK